MKMIKNQGKTKKNLPAAREFYDKSGERVYDWNVSKLRAEFMNQLTRSNMDLLCVIRDENPDSIYQLAKILGQDQPRVQKQCKQLVEMGLIDLEKHEINGRICMKPLVQFKKLVIRIQL